jgi:ubiquinone/menaquinone biosynthesis C-methylase UbiE
VSADGRSGLTNRSIKDDIRDYWSIRAETYDLSFGHGRMEVREANAWRVLIHSHPRPGNGRHALDLGCGTGTMSLLMQAEGIDVTGLDFAGPMLDRARRKARDAGTRIAFVAGDAEQTLEPDARNDAIVARNLLWTLPNPEQAFREWRRILKPGGRLLVIDGDFVRQSRIERFAKLFDGVFGKLQDGHSLVTAAQWDEHHGIVARLPFSAGFRASDLAALFENGGFIALRQNGLQDIRRSRGLHLTTRAGLVAWSQHRFAISGEKPAAETLTGGAVRRAASAAGLRARISVAGRR